MFMIGCGGEWVSVSTSYRDGERWKDQGVVDRRVLFGRTG